MYLRFVVAEIDDDSERGLGIFQAAYHLRDDGKKNRVSNNVGGVKHFWGARV